MVYVFTGENDFAIREALQALETTHSLKAEYFEGPSLDASRLADLFRGVHLFASRRLIVIEHLSTQKVLWDNLTHWLETISDDVTLVLREHKLDKRTTTYKELVQHANIQEYAVWSDRDRPMAVDWVIQRAQSRSIELTRDVARRIVERVGLNQWQLASALEVVSLYSPVTASLVDTIVPGNPTENIFSLFETALQADRTALTSQLTNLKLHEDPYALFALLASQVQSLAALHFKETASEPLKDFGIHPYAARTLGRHAKTLSKPYIVALLSLCAKADDDLKHSRGEPWIVLEKLLFEIANVTQP